MTQIKGQQKHHGRDAYYMVDEGGFRTNKGFISLEDGLHKSLSALAAPAVESEALPSNYSPFRFGSMFIKRDAQPSDNALDILGRAMFRDTSKDTSKTPAGYTFLGQFISHDMSLDAQRSENPLEDVEATFTSRQSPALDLDSLYGREYSESDGIRYQERLYEPNGIMFRLGHTHPAVPVPALPNDLPREDAVTPAGEKFRRAIIGDERNDENLALAQTVVSFLRFHNAVVGRLLHEGKVRSGDLFEKARRIVIKHYQWIVLEDFLPRIIDKDILNEVKTWARHNDPRLDWLGSAPPFMPVEFAVAAFRLGHSLVRSEYEWNRFFESIDGSEAVSHAATFADLFRFTGTVAGLEGHDQLTGNWIVDWRRFYDFSFYGIPPHPKFNLGGVIDPILINNLSALPEFYNQPDLAPNLAVRNLRRGKLLGLASGQEVAAQLKAELGVDRIMLTDQDLRDGPHGEILFNNGLIEHTPLWYYILREAQVLGGGGERLGPVGSYIVARTIVLLIIRSSVSILREGWKPQCCEPLIAPSSDPTRFTMADMIRFCHTKEQPLIYPRGEETQLLPGE